MEWVLWMFAVLVLGAGAVVASGRWGSMPGTERDVPHPDLPETPLTGDDLRGLRFAVVTRGYSMDQVDELLDRLSRQLDGAVSGARPVSDAEPEGSGIMDPGSPQENARVSNGSNEAADR